MTQYEILIHEPETDLWFAWNHSLTVNIRHEPDGQDVDVYTLGGVDTGTFEEFEESVARHVGYILEEAANEV